MKFSGAVITLLVAFVATEIAATPLTTQCGKPADVVFVIDCSSSIWSKDFKDYVLPFVQNVVSMFDIGLGAKQTRVGAVTFSNSVRLEFNLNRHHEKEDLLSAISHIRTRGGNTYTNKALKYVKENMFKPENGGREDVAHIVIVITDGKSSDNPSTIREAESLRKDGSAVFALGVGAAQDAELIQIASEPSSQFKFKVTDFRALDSIKIELALKACEVTVPATTTPKPTTTEAPKRECGGNPADIFFILDSSSSIWQVDFEKRVLGFVRDMVSTFDIGHELTRIGVMTFSDSPRLVIGLDSYNDKQELMKAISPPVVRYTLGGTNTAEALRDARKIGFHKSVARQGVSKIAIVITDGQSWNERKTKKEAALLKESGVMVYAIGVGKGVKQEELEAIANEPKDDFVFSVDGFGALSELKDVLAIQACGSDELQGDQPVCGDGPVDLTFAFDANTMSISDKHSVLNQIQTVTKRLSSLGGEVRLGVTSGECPPSMDFPMSSPAVTSYRVRKIKKEIRPKLHQIVKEWRTKEIGELTKVVKDDGSVKYIKDSSFGDATKGFVLLLNEENISEFGHIAEEVLLLIDSGVEVFAVLDKSLEKHHVQHWIKMIGQRRVVSGVDMESDYSGYIMEFLCAL